MRTPRFSSHCLRGLSILAGVGLTLVAGPASADVELAPLVVIDFSTYDGSGFNPEPAAGQLDSDDWAVRLSGAAAVNFGETGEGNGSVFAWGTSPGDVDDGGIWAFDVDGAGLIALGVQPTENLFTPGRISLRLVNNTGADISEFQVEYTIWVRNDETRANSFNLEESADDIMYNPVGAGFTSPGAVDADGFTATEVVEVITPAAPIADGTQHYIGWSGNDASGSSMGRDEFGIEGITIRLLNVCGNGITDRGEECDDGLENSDTAACTSACAAAVCGDGLVQEGVEECDDMNTDPGDGCAADCTIEPEPGTSSGGSGTTGADTTAGDSGSASAEGSGGDASATGASASASATASAGDSSGDGGGSDEGTGGEDDDSAGCICNSSGGSNPVWTVFGVFGLALARRRRR